MKDFHDLYVRYAGDVHRFATYLSGDPAMADDITSETFLRAWTSAAAIREATVKAYLFTMARNLYFAEARRTSRHADLAGEMPSPEPSVADRSEHRASLDRVLKALRGLPAIDRAALLLRTRDELSYEDIAADSTARRGGGQFLGEGPAHVRAEPAAEAAGVAHEQGLVKIHNAADYFAPRLSFFIPARVIVTPGSGRFDDEALVDELAQMAVERSCLQRDAAAGLLAYRLHYCVPVKVPFSQRPVHTDFTPTRLAGISWTFMRLLRWIARTAGAALVGFHVWLLASQWSAGQLAADPALILRWAASLVLASALIWLGRDGASLVSRRAIVLWLLAALLHGPAVAGRAGESGALQSLPETAATLLIQSTAVAGVLVVALWLIAGLLRRRDAANAAWSFVRIFPAWNFLDDGFSLAVTARHPQAHN